MVAVFQIISNRYPPVNTSYIRMSRSRVGFSCMYKDSNYCRPIDTFGYHELVMNFHEELAILCDWNITLDEVLLIIQRRRLYL